MSDEHVCEVALDDVFNEAKTSEFIRSALSSVLLEEVRAYCDNEGIPMGQVNMLGTLRTAQVFITIVPFRGIHDE